MFEKPKIGCTDARDDSRSKLINKLQIAVIKFHAISDYSLRFPHDVSACSSSSVRLRFQFCCGAISASSRLISFATHSSADICNIGAQRSHVQSFSNLAMRSHIHLEQLTLHVFPLKAMKSCVVLKFVLTPLPGPSWEIECSLILGG